MISDTIEEIATNIANAYDELESKGAELPESKNIENLADTIASIETGGVSTQSQSIFTGYTAPLTWLNSTNNVFTYQSATHNITIAGLSGIATITGNGTKSVTVTIDTTASADRQTAFTIACEYNEQTITYNGIAFHYGSDLGSGNCLAVAKTLDVGHQIEYVFIESASLPKFTSNTATWNGTYPSQIIGFDFGKWRSATLVSYFLSNCYSFNQPLTIPSSVTTIDGYCLYNCYSFNQPLIIPSNVTSIGNYYQANCYSFNQPLTLPENVESIGINFLFTCYSFNRPFTIPNSVELIGTYFFSGCYSFNQLLTISTEVAVINNYFLQNCYSFNQPLILPDSVSSIGSYFLSGCSSFNRPLTIPDSVAGIGNYFMNNCQSFSQPLTIPDSITQIGNTFMLNCYSFIYLDYNAEAYPTDDNSLSLNSNSKTSSTGTGVYVTGTNAVELKSSLPNRTTRPYRKLV